MRYAVNLLSLWIGRKIDWRTVGMAMRERPMAVCGTGGAYHVATLDPNVSMPMVQSKMQEATTANNGVPLRQCFLAMLELSTAHIPRHTAEALGDSGMPESPALWDLISYVHFHTYGWIIYCGSPLPEELQQVHPDLGNLMKVAKESGALYLKLDCDAVKAEGLPLFDW